ncbi:MAG: aminopeptidase [Kiritimatiellae bacterium]|nr:aminopeptidase [Kiritimatiellia bacterium]
MNTGISSPTDRKDATWLLDDAQRKAMNAYSEDYKSFLGIAKTERRAYAEAVRQLEKKGFRELSSFQKLNPGDKVYRGYHGKTLFAAVIGQSPISGGVRVVGGHTDSPRFDLKPVPLMEKSGLAFFDTRYYGGIKKFQWLVRPLALYGTVVKPDGSKVEIAIGDKPGDPVFMITDVLPHYGKEQADKPVREVVPAEDMDLLIGSIPSPGDTDDAKESVKKHIMELLEKTYGITEADFASGELEIVPAGMPRDLGFDRSMILGYGQDDRVCAYAGLKALMDVVGVPEQTSVLLLCDKEEIGSVGASGMDSTFFANSVAELIERQEANPRDIHVRRALEASRMLSADVCAAADPHFPDADSPNNMAQINAGPCIIKYTGPDGKKGASDARAEYIADLRRVFDAAGVVWQIGELGRAEKGGGGTIAKFMAYYGMDVVDMGTPLLNMHAPAEVSSKLDAYMTYRAYHAFFTATTK